MLSVSQSAELLGISASRVRFLIKSGSLHATKVGHAWLLEEKDVLQRASKHPKAGRPATRKNLEHSFERTTDELDSEGIDGHKLYVSCKEYFRFRPSSETIRHAATAEEASFYMAVADFFLQQRQAQLVAEGIY